MQLHCFVNGRGRTSIGLWRLPGMMADHRRQRRRTWCRLPLPVDSVGRLSPGDGHHAPHFALKWTSSQEMPRALRPAYRLEEDQDDYVYVLDVLPALVAHGYKGRARAFSELTNDELEHLAAKTAICCRQKPFIDRRYCQVAWSARVAARRASSSVMPRPGSSESVSQPSASGLIAVVSGKSRTSGVHSGGSKGYSR